MRTLPGASNRQRVAWPGGHRIQSGPVTSTTSPTERVGRYQLLEPIGIGPSGAVSRAKVFGVAGFERQFAVKRFHAELTATAAMAAMLSAAARAYGSLEHPRIARMSEFGVAQGATFTAVEYVVGLDALRLISEARLAGSSLATGGALALVSQAARAVGYAHGRGLTHLGLAPTNVIVTADGDIKITDFGILSATLPQRPIEAPRLAQRIPYLAPEQLANEATSAATDVFALGVLAYELVTGNRTFRGDTPQQIASAIMAGPPAEPALPRPIVRVLQRCLARSPFERFPDARALADALDAALRVAPVPGTRKDIGSQVKETLDRLAALNEGQLSGVVALHLGTGPIRRVDDEARADVDAPESWQDAAPTATQLPARPRPALASAAAPTTTLPDLPRPPITTMPGVAPPPIPVPPGISVPGSPTPAAPIGTNTLMGMGKAPAAIPEIRPRAGSATGIGAAKPPAIPPAALRPGTRPGTDLPPDLEAPRVDGSHVDTLDPDDLVALEPGSGDAAEHAAEALSLAQPEPAPAPPRSSYALDPASVDTKPIAPVELGPLLFDPISRPSPEERGGADDAVTVDQDHDFDPRAHTEAAERAAAAPASAMPTAHSAPAAAPASAMPTAHSARAAAPASAMPTAHSARTAAPASAMPTAQSAPAAAPASPPLGLTDPRQAHTILGFAAPLPAPRPPTTPPRPLDWQEPSAEPQTDEMSRMLLEGFRKVPAPVASPGFAPEPHHPRADEPPPDTAAPEPRPPEYQPPHETPAGPPPHETPAEPPHETPAEPPPAGPPPGWVTAPPVVAALPAGATQSTRGSRRGRWVAVALVLAAAAGVGAWQLYVRAQASPEAPVGATPLAKPPQDAAQVAVAASDATARDAGGPAGPDASAVAAAATDAAAAPDALAVAAARDAATNGSAVAIAGHDAAPADATRVAIAAVDAGAGPGDAAASVAVQPGVATTGGSSLAIASTPPGARVFLDGADTGATPVKLAGSPDRHTIALLLAGHELYVAQVDGHGTFQIPLKEVTPSNGPAGIKVLRCKDKDRYYVFVDGKPTGQTCPTERIGCDVGPHSVEVYDVVSETRRKWDIVVKDTRLSFRVRVE